MLASYCPYSYILVTAKDTLGIVPLILPVHALETCCGRQGAPPHRTGDGLLLPARAAAARPPHHWRSGAAQMPPPPRQLPALPGGAHAMTAKRARWADNSRDMCSAWPPLRTHSDVLYAVHRAMHGAVGDLMDLCLQNAISSLQGHWHGLAKRKACNRRESPLHSTCAGLQTRMCETLLKASGKQLWVSCQAGAPVSPSPCLPASP